RTPLSPPQARRRPSWLKAARRVPPRPPLCSSSQTSPSGKRPRVRTAVSGPPSVRTEWACQPPAGATAAGGPGACRRPPPPPAGPPRAPPRQRPAAPKHAAGGGGGAARGAPPPPLRLRTGAAGAPRRHVPHLDAVGGGGLTRPGPEVEAAVRRQVVLEEHPL